MDHVETYGANIFFLFCNKSLQLLAARKNLAARKILLCHNIIWGGGASATVFVEETIIKNCKTRKWERN